MSRGGYTWRQPPYPGDESDLRWINPSMLVLCENADIDGAIVPLLRTLYEPIAKGLIGAIFVHETMRKELIEKLRARMTVMHRQVKSHKLYAKALSRAKCLGVELVSMMQPDDIGFHYSMVEGSPLVVCDFNQSYFSANHPSTVVTLHTFRHSQELDELTKKEKLPFTSASVWCPKMSTAYEIALLLNVPIVYINCADVILSPIIENFQANQPIALLHGDYHFDVLLQMGKAKSIIFPTIVRDDSSPS